MENQVVADEVSIMTESNNDLNKTVEYCTVKFTVGWLPGSVGFTEAAKSALAEARGTDKKAIRGSYAILGASRDPLIKEGTALKRILTTIRDEYTIPEYTLRASSATPDEENQKPQKVAGSYLIESCKIEEFLSRFEEARQQYLAWGKRVAEAENYERIREADRISLDKDWEVIERKYPSAEAMADSVSCDMPKIEPFDASFTLADVAPETSKKLREQAEARLNASIEGATAELIFDFKNMVEAVAKNCGKRIRLIPPAEHARSNLRHAEVLSIVRHEDDDGVPEGKILLTVQPARPKSDDSDKFVNTGKPVDLLLSPAEYSELKPFETDEYKQLTQASFDNLVWLAKKISTVKGMLTNDNDADSITKLAKEVEGAIGDLGGSASEITKQLKNSSYARNAARQTFTDFFNRLKDKEIEVRTKSKVKRKIKVITNE